MPATMTEETGIVELHAEKLKLSGDGEAIPEPCVPSGPTFLRWAVSMVLGELRKN